MAWLLKVAELLDWFLVHLDDWTEPVTVGQLNAAGGDYTKAQITAAIKHLHERDLIYKHHEGRHGLVYWLPCIRQPKCAAQELICQGPQRFYERANHEQ